MGQKVNPHGLRVGIIKDWDSRWYAEDAFADNLVEDDKIRKYVKKRLYNAGISKIEIERASDRVKLIVYTAKPGVVIGKGGSSIEELKKDLQKMTDKKLLIDVKEVKRPDKDAQLVAENIAQQLENRISFRRAMKSCMQRTIEIWSSWNQNIRFWTFRWSRYGTYRILQRGNNSSTDTSC